MIICVYILPVLHFKKWVSAQKYIFVHTNYLKKCQLLCVHFGFVCTFCGHFAHFLPKFSPKSGQNLYTQNGVLYTQNQAKIDILYTQTTKNRHFGVHFGFWCTFCGQKPTFFFYLIMIKSLYILYRFGEKKWVSGQICTHKVFLYIQTVCLRPKSSMI